MDQLRPLRSGRAGHPAPEATPTPASLDWQTWLGPADVDWGYNENYAHFNWRGWLPFGNAAIGDMGAHLIDFPFWALEPGLPTKLEVRHTRWGADIRAPGLDRADSARRLSPGQHCSHYEFGTPRAGRC